MNIPQHIKNKIVGEANWRSTNGHGGVDDITRDNFILAAEFGYSLVDESQASDKDKEIADLKHAVDSFESMAKEFKEEIERLKGLIETAYIDGWRFSSTDTPLSNKLQQFKQQHNL